MEIDEIEQLVSLVRDARISELTVSAGSGNPSKVTIRKSLAIKPAPAAKKRSGSTARKSEPAEASQKSAAASVDMYITAPMVGIFHGIDSISAIGAAVSVGQVIGSIESMKLMNDIVASRNGVIAEILVEDGMSVEYGQQLFRMDHL